MNTSITKPAENETAVARHTWRRPRYNVVENDDAFALSVYLPGVKREGIDISLEGDDLTITGTPTRKTEEGWKAIHRELPEGDFRIELKLNVEVQQDTISAALEDGILNLTLPKAESVKPRKIKVQ